MGGGITFSPNNLSKIPLPKVGTDEIARLESMSDQYSIKFTEDEQNALDAHMYELFNLTDEEITVIEDFKVTSRPKR